MGLLELFIILNIANVILQTIKSICTVKCGKWGASLVNAIAYGLYTIVIVYTNCDLDLWAKVIVVAGSNLIGVFIVKLLEEKLQKDKLWKIDLTVRTDKKKYIESELISKHIPYCYNDFGKHTMFSAFCQTQEQSKYIADLVQKYNGKYFVTENRSCLY